MEARPPAENRHGGAPRGERPASWDAPRLTERGCRASHARQQHKCACRRSARPSLGRVRRDKHKPGRRHAPRERRTLRCLTSLVETTANGSFASLRSLVSRASAARHRSRACPRSAVRRRKSGKPDLRAPRGDTTDRSRQPYCASRLLRWVPALVPFGFASLHSAGTRALAKRTHVAKSQQSLLQRAQTLYPSHREERRVSKDGWTPIDLPALMVRDAPCGASHLDATALCTGARQASSCALSCTRSRLRPISTSLFVLGPSHRLSSREKRFATR